jgi:predicted dehydrogenase
LTVTGGAILAPVIVPATALGAEGSTSPSERIVMGAIGQGGRGRYDIGAFMGNGDVQMVAICEVRGDRRSAAKDRVNKQYGNKDCKAYLDLRELLARRDIDAVMIATGDNWHSMASILAARAGKDMYCEKPLSVCITESRAVVQTMRDYGRVFQCGMQRRNVGNFVFAMDLARSGKLGKLKAVHAEKQSPLSGVKETIYPAEKEPPREVMDWNMWLGVATWRPYNKNYYQRKIWKDHADFSGGSICEWGSHTVDLCQHAASADDTTPVHYKTYNEKGDVEATYANGLKLFIRKGLRFGSCPVRFEGEEGWVETGDAGKIETHPTSLLGELRFKGGYPANNHVREFLDCVKSRRPTKATADVAHNSITACHCANVAVRLGRPVKWDPVKEEFPGDDEANRLRSRAIRQPWRL